MAQMPQPNPASASPIRSNEVAPEDRARVEREIAMGNGEKALEVAKAIHKRRPCVESESLLADAYELRFHDQLERGLDASAHELIKHIIRKFPSTAERVGGWEFAFEVRAGNLEPALRVLNDAARPPELHALIGNFIRRYVFDLRGIANTGILSPEHPIRAAAIALTKAFEAVTSGPVTEDQLALVEVSRQSPLSPWKMIIRAIAAFYRREDDLCEKYLAAVDRHSAALRLKPALRMLMRKRGPSRGAEIALGGQVGGDLERLRQSLTNLDHAIANRQPRPILSAIHQAVAACADVSPTLLERLRQHIFVRLGGVKLKAKDLRSALGPCVHDAYFWRLMARTAESESGRPVAIPLACCYWDEFGRHAVHEGLFPAKGPEIAALCLHMVELWARVEPDSVERAQQEFFRVFAGYEQYYRGQSSEIQALRPPSPRTYFLHPIEILERACEADPCSENFARWLKAAAKTSHADEVAAIWSEALPGDIPPLLHLMHSAEQRNALQKAFKLMERAEQIDGLNSAVRRARLRLLVSMALRHFKESKPKLAARELTQLEALPQAQQGDRPAFIAALRWIWSFAEGTPGQASAIRASVVQRLGSELATQVVFAGVLDRIGMKHSDVEEPPRGAPVAAAVGRACALGEDMGVPFDIPETLLDRLEKEISAADFSAPVAALIALGETALRQGLFPMAYAIAGAGLAQGSEGLARFLYLRAGGMPPWEAERRGRCLAAASELARRQRDNDLLDRIGTLREEIFDWYEAEGNGPSTTVSSDEIARLVTEEGQHRGYPKPRPAGREQECNCPKCRAERDLPIPPELEEMMEMIGPDGMAEALSEIIDSFVRPRKRRGRKPRFPFDDKNSPF